MDVLVEIPGFQAFVYSSLDSTSDEARRLLAAGRIHGPAYVLANAQTAGRGTRGRSWLSPAGAGLYVTLADPGVSGLALTPAYTLAAGVACAETLRELTGLDIRLKPVNDLYVDGRKLGGILVESLVQEGRMRALLTGIGLNISRAERPVAGVKPVCIEELLSPVAFRHFDPQELLEALLPRVLYWQQRVSGGEVPAVLAAWQGFQLSGTTPLGPVL